MVVIGLLAAILIPYFARARFSAELAACKDNLRGLGMSVQMYSQENDQLYPGTLDTLTQMSKGMKGYVGQMPTDPSNSKTYANSYSVSSDYKSFTIYCPGTHYKVFPEIPEGYPQYTSASGKTVDSP